MKKTVKALLGRAGLLDPLLHAYSDLKTARPDVLLRALRYRRHGAPDGLPLPPPPLRFAVIACRWAPLFYDSGARIVADMLRLLGKSGIVLGPAHTVLDFGCGCGRLLRHLHRLTPARLFGSDYNPDLIAWCRAHLPFAQFSTNALAPPLPYEDAAFDFVYARSVFTHLTEDLQLAWMEELHRVLKQDGILYFTTHGRPLARGLNGAQKAAFDAGRLVVTFPEVAGENLCAAYTPRRFVEERLLHGFDLVDFVEGRDAEHLRQDVCLLRKKGRRD